MAETVCQYHDCSTQLQDPKLLPCLHRYCTDCLTSVIQSAKEGMFKCSVCKKDCKIPENGVDGFETDLHMTGRLLLNKLQDSFVNKDQKQLCVTSCKESTTPANCFKCQQCYQIHPTFRMCQDHQLHTLNLETIEEINSETISPFTVDIMCADHETERAQSCCSLCGGVPICVTCATGMHEGHELRDVSELAKRGRESLGEKLLDTFKQREDIDGVLTTVNAAALQLKTISEEFKRQLQLTESDTMRARILRSKHAERYTLRVKFENDMKKLDQKYDQELREIHNKIQADWQHNPENINQNGQKRLETGQIESKLQGIFDFGKQLIERNKNVKATSLSILDSKHLWSHNQCIPYFTRDIKSLTLLVKDIGRKLTEIASDHDVILMGTYKCENSNCVVCEKHIVTSVDIKGTANNKTYNTVGRITCTTSNVIYLITCDICGSQYVGETTGMLKTRIIHHRSTVAKNESENKFITHFNSENHSRRNMRVQGIKAPCRNLRTEETKWMKKLDTISQGLNNNVGKRRKKKRRKK